MKFFATFAILFLAVTASANDKTQFVCDIEYRGDNGNQYLLTRGQTELNESSDQQKEEKTKLITEDNLFVIEATYHSNYVFRSNGGAPTRYTGEDYVELVITFKSTGLKMHYNQAPFSRQAHGYGRFQAFFSDRIGTVVGQNLTTNQRESFEPNYASIRCLTGLFSN